MTWEAGDLESINRDDARDGALDVEHFRQQRRRDEAAAREREERFRMSVEHFRERACSLLLQSTAWSVERAARYALAAERVEMWRREAFRKGFGT